MDYIKVFDSYGNQLVYFEPLAGMEKEEISLHVAEIIMRCDNRNFIHALYEDGSFILGFVMLHFHIQNNGRYYQVSKTSCILDTENIFSDVKELAIRALTAI